MESFIAILLYQRRLKKCRFFADSFPEYNQHSQNTCRLWNYGCNEQVSSCQQNKQLRYCKLEYFLQLGKSYRLIPAFFLASFLNEIRANPFIIISPSNNQLLRYNSTTGKWQNWTPDYLTGYTETDPLWTSVSVNYYTKMNLEMPGIVTDKFR